jgi:hypothetical protein
MKYDKYFIKASASLLKYEFRSEGPRGVITKQVAFKAFKENPNVYNLGFGDVDENGEISDIVISNNQDSRKVLATVALTVYKFCEKYPDCYVFATGSTPTRTRLYRIGITNNLVEIRKDFNLFGHIDDAWERFEKGRDYEAFLIKKKK